MCKRLFIMNLEVNNFEDVKTLCPWAKHIAKRENGYFCFELKEEYKIWKDKIKKDPQLKGWG